MASACLHQVFEEQADRTPTATALVCGDRRLTYAELDRRANQLARRLMRLGVRPGSHVAIFCDRSELPIIAVLACHKSGATYVPIEPTSPVEHVQHINHELEISLCLTDSRQAGPAGELFADAELVVVDGEWPEEDTRIDSGVTPEDLAYVIYTSDTAGLMTEHRQVTHFVQVFNEVCGTSVDDRVYQGFPLSFDGSVEQIWLAFANGSTLVAPTEDAPRFGDELGRYLADLGITYLSTVPTLLATITTEIPSLRTVVVSAEPCPPELVNRWARSDLRFFNAYGPSEATVHTTVAECLPEKPVTVGLPLRGYGTHIVDDKLCLVSPGDKGELLISGTGLARGYVKQPGMTARRFLYSEDGSQRFFRTGDLVRRNEDGELELLGRVDDQVEPAVSAPTSSIPSIADLRRLIEKSDSAFARKRFITWVLQAVSLYLLAALVAVPLALVFLLAFNWVEGTLSTVDMIGFGVLLTVCTWPALILFSVAAKWLIIGRIRPGEHKLWSRYYWRWWLVDRIVTLSGAAAMNGTPLLPLYYRLMGARVGSGCSLNTVHCAAWDLVSIGADTSIGAHTQILGCRVENDMLRFGRVDIGNRCFIGIRAVVGLNVCMGDESSLDDQSLLPDGALIHEGEVHRGSPAERATVSLPTGAIRYAPSRRLVFGIAHFLAIQTMSVALLLAPVIGFLAQTWFLVRAGVGIADLFLVPVDVIVLSLYLTALKRLVLPRMRPGTYPVLSLLYFRKWLSDSLMAASRILLLPVHTTLYLPPLLRLMGARIGKGAEISTVTGLAPELVEVGERSFLADGSIIGGRRCHRGVFEVAVNRIGRGGVVGPGSMLPVGSNLDDSVDPTVEPTRGLYWQRAFIDGLRILIPYYVVLYAAIMFSCTLFLLHQIAGTAAVIVFSPLVAMVFGVAAALAVVAVKEAVVGRIKPEPQPLWSKDARLNGLVDGAYESIMAPVLTPLLGTPFATPFLRMMDRSAP